MERDLKNTNEEQAKANGWEIIKPFPGEIVGKATFEGSEDFQGNPVGIKIMKSTKRFKVEGGWIYNTSTEIHKGINIAIAEALVFVPVQ